MFTRGNVICGKTYADFLRQRVKKARACFSFDITLAVILVGDDPASQVYVKNKARACQEVGIHSRTITLPACTSQRVLNDTIISLNHDAAIHGILLQLPLPHPLNDLEALSHLDPNKDVDGLTSHNLGALFSHHTPLVPCTPKGCMGLLRALTTLQGKHVVVVGRSRLVGRPLSALLLKENATVTVAHKHTQNLADMTRAADIIISAAGHPKLITKRHVSKGAIVLDVGINRQSIGDTIQHASTVPPNAASHTWKSILVGDVDFEEVAPLCAYITPVPGGIGPVTVASLLENVLIAARLQHPAHPPLPFEL